MLRKYAVFLLPAFAVLFFLLAAASSDSKTTLRPAYEKSSLTIVKADGASFSFKTEVAKTPEEQAYGLMFKLSLADDEGMIFLFTQPKKAVFWMKNTFIPLDMLFVAPNGAIESISHNAKPQDLTPISSENPVLAVVEIKGGLAGKIGLKKGDKVVYPTLPSAP